MKRRTLDIIFASGGIVFAAILAILGVFVFSQYQFSQDYVKQELSAQKITFATADKLTDAEKNWQPGSACLTTYAGQLMSSGPMAECYAKYFIREHMKTAGETAGYPGATYATVGAVQGDLRAQIAAANAKNDKTAADAAQKKLDAATSLRTTLQTGETLSGLLLTVYGFSVIGNIAGIASYAIFALAVLMAALSAAGFVHAFVVPQDEIVFQPKGVRVPVPA